MQVRPLCSFINRFNKPDREPWLFKLNNSLLLNEDYQETIKKYIAKTVEINKNANPNTKWERIKGTVRYEIIKYATFKKKETN